MGEVHRGRAIRLDRDVAIKILPAGFCVRTLRYLCGSSARPKTLAALNASQHRAHPRGAEDDGVTRAIVMELVEGEDLGADVWLGAPITLATSLVIAGQVADACGQADDDTCIVHRDLKPANVKVKADGTVKLLLILGLVKAAPSSPASALSHSPTMVESMCGNVLLGTAGHVARAGEGRTRRRPRRRVGLRFVP